MGKEWRENHTSGNAKASKRHFATHCESHLATLEPFHDTARHGDTCHFNTTAENHEADSREFSRCRHTFIERRHTHLVEKRDVVEILGEPFLKPRALEHCCYRIPVDGGTDKHYGTRKHGGESHAHFVEDNTGKNEEENKNIEECFRTLHCTEGCFVPTSSRLHQILNRREDVHEDIGTEHRKRQEE